ncbi:Kv channel-interacting protein 1-like [Oppia nitens]|uniref:Kv channel-interacting protein 1-like n=1 Tax=Oppia nitens TaxID=1686743 RepID=UPI0023DAF4B6|nr:Kv channel-interacting protein 1-like [Oppia nitens]
MYSGMTSTLSSGRKLRHRSDTQSCRQSAGQHSKLLTQSVIKTREKSVTRRVMAYLKEAWNGPIEEDSDFEDLDGQHTHFRPEAIDTLCQMTKFNKRELQLMYRGFKQEAPSGVVREETFKLIYAQFFPKGADTTQYAHYVFQTFDPDHTGAITFTDFVIGLSVLARGTIKDKLRWTFSLYDINNDGMITKDELSRIVSSIYDLMGKSVEPMIEEQTSKDHVERVFQKLDINNDGFVTVDQFLDYCLKDETITRSLEVFNTML